MKTNFSNIITSQEYKTETAALIEYTSLVFSKRSTHLFVRLIFLVSDLDGKATFISVSRIFIGMTVEFMPLKSLHYYFLFSRIN